MDFNSAAPFKIPTESILFKASMFLFKVWMNSVNLLHVSILLILCPTYFLFLKALHDYIPVRDHWCNTQQAFLELYFFFPSPSGGSQLCVVITLRAMPRLIYDSSAGCFHDETLVFWVFFKYISRLQLLRDRTLRGR